MPLLPSNINGSLLLQNIDLLFRMGRTGEKTINSDLFWERDENKNHNGRIGWDGPDMHWSDWDRSRPQDQQWPHKLPKNW